jgi:heme exporter protein C
MISWLANPVRFAKFARFASPLFALAAFACIMAGLWTGLFTSPPEEFQGDSVRIMYVHVPAAWIAMMAYSFIAVASFTAYVWRHPLADIVARASALPGAAFTALALVTGSLWGSQTWMTYWEWDGRMTSMLVLLFIYIGYMAIWAVMRDKKRAARIAGLIAMVGAINIPIIKFSVDWWDDSLHQKATISSPGAPGMGPEFLTPLFLMMFGFSCLFGWLVINRVLTALAVNKREAASRAGAGARPATVTVETL